MVKYIEHALLTLLNLYSLMTFWNTQSYQNQLMISFINPDMQNQLEQFIIWLPQSWIKVSKSYSWQSVDVVLIIYICNLIGWFLTFSSGQKTRWQIIGKCQYQRQILQPKYGYHCGRRCTQSHKQRLLLESTRLDHSCYPLNSTISCTFFILRLCFTFVHICAMFECDKETQTE